jgi:hypothetical protein
MIFPKGEIRHEDLSTAYTNLPALLSSLKTEGFSGTLEIEFPEVKGIVLLHTGEVANAEARRNSDSKRLTGPEAVRSLLSHSEQKNGRLSIYRWAPEKVSMMANNIQHEILFKGLATEFTRLDRLIMTLREGKHDGFIEILTKDQSPMGVLFIQGGEPVDLFVTQESGSSTVDRKMIPTFLEDVVKQGAILNVYKGQARAAAVPRGTIEVKAEEGLKEVILVLQEVLSRVERFVDGGSKRGAFIKVFKRALIERSGDYPFLDPFAGEFDYRDGTITFEGEAKVKEFAKGIGECLRLALNYLEEETPKNKVPFVKLRAGIESSLEEKRDQLRRLGLDSVMTSFLQ